MKNLLSLVIIIVLFIGCGHNGENSNKTIITGEKTTDSLNNIIHKKDREINNMMGTLNEIQECFRLINETEDRITLAKNSEGIDRQTFILENIEFIQKRMRQNRELIKKLQQQVKESSYDSEQLRKTVANYIIQLADKDKEINMLKAQLSAKDIEIRELDDKLDRTADELVAASKDNSEKARLIASNNTTIAQQEQKLNEAFYVFGTKKELKTQHILDSNTLTFSESNKDYFTKIDIRVDTEIKLFSKSARILTHHSSGSYMLQPDSKGQYILKITDPTSFWRTSKYLVIMVK